MKWYFSFTVDGMTRFAMIEAATSGEAQTLLQKSIFDAYGEQDEGTRRQNSAGNRLYIDFGTGNVDPDTIGKLSDQYDQESARRDDRWMDDKIEPEFTVLGGQADTSTKTAQETVTGKITEPPRKPSPGDEPPTGADGEPMVWNSLQENWTDSTRDNGALIFDPNLNKYVPVQDTKVPQVQSDLYDPLPDPDVQAGMGLEFGDFLRERARAGGAAAALAEDRDPYRYQLGGRARLPIWRRQQEAEAALRGMQALSQLERQRAKATRDTEDPFKRQTFGGVDESTTWGQFLGGMGEGFPTGEADDVLGSRARWLLQQIAAPSARGAMGILPEKLQDAYTGMAMGEQVLSPEQLQQLATAGMRESVSPYFRQQLLPGVLRNLREGWGTQQARNLPGRESFAGYLMANLPGLGYTVN